MENLICEACGSDWWEVRHLIKTSLAQATNALSAGMEPLAHARAVVLVCGRCDAQWAPNPNPPPLT